MISLAATSACEDLPLQRGCPTALTEFDGRRGHHIDAGDPPLNDRSTVRACTGDWYRPRLSGHHGTPLSLCSDALVYCKRQT